MAKTWLITGASSGLGLCIARAAAERGDRVAVTARREEDLGEFENRYRLDVTDADQVRDAVSAAVADLGRIDVLVNNAGHGLIGASEEVTVEELRELFEVNVFGAHRVTREALPHLRGQRSGHIVQMSSVGGIVANPGHAAYAASKFALEGLSEALAAEVAPWNIAVTLVEPGPFRTDFAGRSLRESTAMPAYVGTPAGNLRDSFRNQDQKQPNDPMLAAAAILEAVDATEPPLRLPLGPEAIGRIRTKLTAQLADLDSLSAAAMNTAFVE